MNTSNKYVKTTFWFTTSKHHHTDNLHVYKLSMFFSKNGTLTLIFKPHLLATNTSD